MSEGGICLVLGAGNVSAIGAQDALDKLFNEDEVVILKCNPVNDWVGPQYLKALAPLVEGGFLQVCYGGALQGAHLTQHASVTSIHITGSDAAMRVKSRNPDAENRITSFFNCCSKSTAVPTMV